ncbi:MAG: acyl-CoA dehydrogenase family protein [Planctomycetes bacterium]|nr:acyl-CoA dehydrogenase family protein [Planctomycetota bacterium]
MEFDLTDDQRQIQEAVRAFSAAEVAPYASKWDEEQRLPPEIYQKLGGLGLMGMTVPEDHGGAGVDFISSILAIEELAYAHGSLALSVAAHNSLACGQIEASGTPEQKAKFLVPLASGRKLGAWALTESVSGSDAAGMRSTAVPARGGWELNGSKQFTTNGAAADLYVIMVKTDPAAGSHGITAFIVERGTPGLTVGKKEDKLGMRASDTVSLTLDHVHVPSENLLGQPGHGFIDALARLDRGRVGIGGMAIGLGRAALDAAVAYAGQREQFGQSLASFQAIQWMIADSATELEAAQLLVLRAASLQQRSLPCTKECAMAKLFASEAGLRVTDRALQIHGGYGYIRETRVERYFRDARLCTIGEGTSEIQRLVIARRILETARP